MSAKKTKPSKATLNRREALRAQKQAEARRHKRNRIIAVIAAVVTLTLVVSLVAWLIVRNQPAPIPRPTPSGNQVAPPDGDAQRAWITVPSSNTKSDAMIVDIQFDYQCPYCATVEDAYAVNFETLNDQGDIVLRNHTRTFLDKRFNNDSSERAAVAAACVDYADSTKYTAYHNLIFADQPPADKEGTGYTDDQLRNQFTATVGLTGDALTSFQGCYDQQQTLTFVRQVESNNAQPIANQTPPNNYLFGGNKPNADDAKGTCTGKAGSAIGVCGTPDFYVNGVEFTFGDLVNSDFSPKLTTVDQLLAFLQAKAAQQ